MSTLDLLLVAVGLLGLVVAALSARIRQLPLSEPLLALAAGVVLGPQVLGIIELPSITSDHATLHEASRVLLAISVMGVALRYPFAAVRAQWRGVTVLLLVALPAMALVSTGLSMWILGTSFAAALLIGTAVCPTDPVLASSVVTGEQAEEDLPDHDRQLLSLESGANDGLALPLVLVAIAVAGPLTGTHAALETAWQVLGAIVFGVVAGAAAGKALHFGEEHGATEHGPILLFTIVLALLVLGVSGLLELDGVLAVFAAGLAFNLVSAGSERRMEVSIDEVVNRFATLPFFLALGVMLPWPEWRELGWPVVLLAVAVLLLRRLPVLFALMRPLHLPGPGAAYLGWFGPVGVAAIFYLTMEAQRLGVRPDVLAAGTMIVVASTVAHGLTAAPGRAAYRRLSSSDRRGSSTS
jgi:sodium/hydrogen antiporter